MEAGRTRWVPVAVLLCEELRLVEGVVVGRRRRRVYRHHVFFRALLTLRDALAKALPSFAQHGPAPPQRMITRILALAVRCGEAATVELSAARVDTFALAALVLAIASRVGCLFGALSVREQGAFADFLSAEEEDSGRLQKKRGARFLVAQPQRRQKRSRSFEGAVPLQRPTIGGIIETVLQ
ncbi:hypothetical protein TraAM80_08152 [Trypanosoma rangeli]|uniref:Uncharacterized protein n=1 Tax=Trypanosoma rangeli TaxID=5698 RepID=A0A3R7LLH4_TRYRA|nr:uncharacterized protein TraAM80_08152 [Trypanosoma rangeli]RNE99486.1 hypothetical protein TraAM80_08152 [Trypanosoma rangeli]|eukprot:RNE99486.1 hypothetical protein TraAM80_08152 [Trypanosoma rangeli]